MYSFTPEVSIQFTANILVQFHTTPYPDITSAYFQRLILLGFYLLHMVAFHAISQSKCDVHFFSCLHTCNVYHISQLTG